MLNKNFRGIIFKFLLNLYVAVLSIQTYSPKALSPLIRSFWQLKVSDKLDQPYVEEILPDGHHEIIFHLSSPPLRKRDSKRGWQKDPRIFFAGQNRKSYLQQLQPGSVIYAVRFLPHTQALFYDFPASLSTDNLIDFHDVAGTDVLTSCITESATETFAHLEKEFTKKASRIDYQKSVFLYVDASIQHILEQKGNIRISTLEKLTGVSSRYLEKAFQKYVGVTPKQFCNLIRYNHFVTCKKNNPEKTLTQCAYEASFYDQSHLINSSNQITDTSPKAYFSKPSHINDHFLVN